MKRHATILILLLALTLPCAAQEARPFSLSGSRGFSGNIALHAMQFGTEANLRYSFASPIELGAMVGLGPYLFPAIENAATYPDLALTYGLAMAKAGAFVRIPVSILPWLVLTPELSGVMRWEIQYARARSLRYGFDRKFYDAPWVIEADLRLELDAYPARIFGFKPLDGLAVRLGFDTPLADIAIRYDRWRYYAGLSWEFKPPAH